MIPSIRKAYNAAFTQARYEAFVHDLNAAEEFPLDFRVAESPLFLSSELTAELHRACGEVLDAVTDPSYLQQSLNAIPPELNVPGQDAHPAFLQIDFAICGDGHGNFFPRLIELQGFPSLYCFQVLLDDCTRRHFEIPPGFSAYFSGLTRETYLGSLKELIVGDADPEQTILLEIEPHKQKTRVDFASTKRLLGIPFVCLSDLVERGENVFYKNNGREIPVSRIYNRVIFDELARRDFKSDFSFMRPHKSTWVGHPNWFFRISKYSLPYIRSSYCPRAFFVNELAEVPEDLHNYVLKPLFSFAGAGVEVNVTREMMAGLANKQNYILQRKIDYAPLVQTPDGFAKAEIRMMFVWNDRPVLVNNLVRMSRGNMMGVAFNKDKTWVGSSLAYHV